MGAVIARRATSWQGLDEYLKTKNNMAELKDQLSLLGRNTEYKQTILPTFWRL
jgi:hypothetical protein